MSRLPMYFTVCAGPGLRYKMFHNTLYKSIHTVGNEVNVIWPVEGVSSEKLRKNVSNGIDIISYIRVWNHKKYNVCNWSFSGSNIEVNINGTTVVSPIISISPDDLEKLPYNGHSFVPNEEVFDDRRPRYLEPHLYSTDPGKEMSIPHTLRALPIDSSSFNDIPVATIVPMVPPNKPVALAPVVVQARQVQVQVQARQVQVQARQVQAKMPSLPNHIIKIVLAEAVRKNELCPITNDPLTEKDSTVTPCGHIFSSDAINTWLTSPQSKGLCPVCKTHILF